MARQFKPVRFFVMMATAALVVAVVAAFYTHRAAYGRPAQERAAYSIGVDEGSVHSCVINGKDYGQLLYTLGVMGWLMLVTLPAGVFAFVLWLVVLIIHRTNWRRHAAS